MDYEWIVTRSEWNPRNAKSKVSVICEFDENEATKAFDRFDEEVEKLNWEYREAVLKHFDAESNKITMLWEFDLNYRAHYIVNVIGEDEKQDYYKDVAIKIFKIVR